MLDRRKKTKENRKRKMKYYYRISIIVAVLLLTALVVSSMAKTGEGTEDKIIKIEHNNPVYSDTVEPGTELGSIELPEVLRAVVDIEDLNTEYVFEAADPEKDELGEYEFYQHGYIKISEEQNIYVIRYAEEADEYRTYGSLNGADNKWYACSQEGNITEEIVEIPVTWNTESYQPEMEAEYIFEAEINGYIYEGEIPTAKIIVKQIELEEHSHDDAEEDLDDVPIASASIAPFAIDNPLLESKGTNDSVMNTYMETTLMTSGNDPTTSDYAADLEIPGTWLDYVNTIWYNKGALKFHWTMDENITGVSDDWKWNGNAADLDGDPSVNASNKPIRNGTTWDVYSGQQLRSALENFESGDTISIQRNIDMKGYEHNWVLIRLGNVKHLTVLGNNCTIYNLGITNVNEGSHALFLAEFASITMTDLSFTTMKTVSKGSTVGTGLFWAAGVENGVSTLDNIHIDSSMFFSTLDAANPFGRIASTGVNHSVKINNCSVEDSLVYGRDHISGFAIGLGSTNAPGIISETKNTYSVNTLICGTGAHSSAFNPCSGEYYNIKNCFAANEVYGSVMVSGFQGSFTGKTENSYATGKVEGYRYVGGFSFSTTAYNRTINNCYSTVLVGLRSGAANQGSFIANKQNSNRKEIITNSYSAGEVGDFDVNMDNPASVGGFISNINGNVTMENCYYDKQTTAMREWVAGDFNTELQGQDYPGIQGLLTSSTDKAGVGMASGSYFGLDTADWTYKADHYPQLNVFNQADTAIWGDRTDTVKAYSEASTSTIFSNTWDQGYEWDEHGLRSASEITYNKPSGSHSAGKNTYDTVREIITDFTVTKDSSWEQMIQGGGKVDIDGDQNVDLGISPFVISSPNGEVNSPGMDWYRINASSGEAVGYRPIRLISYMDLEAGENVSIAAGTSYDHREDVLLTMMYSLEDNKVVGFHDEEVWSTAMQGGYPDSTKYWAVETTNMVTPFTASQNALLYTEIWVAKQNADGSFVTDTNENYVADHSVKVTGEGTGNNTTLDEKKWNGETPLYLDTFSHQKYLISYYWQLEDGRYRSDSKVVDIIPGKYNLTMDVYNTKDNSVNSDTLSLDVQVDMSGSPAYNVNGQAASSHQEITEQVFGTNLTAAWGIQKDLITIDRLEIVLTGAGDMTGIVLGNAVVEGPITAGTVITIPTTYYYPAIESDEQGLREVTKEAEVEVSYTVIQDQNGDFYLRFHKLLHPELAGLTSDTGDSTGITGAPDDLYLNDIGFNTAIKLYVSEGTSFEFIKVNEQGAAMDGVEFTLFTCIKADEPGHVHSELADNTLESCWDIQNPKEVVVSGAGEIAGKVLFEGLIPGDYMLAETKTLSSYSLPLGQWMLSIDTNGDIAIQARGEAPPAFKKETDGTEVVLKLSNYKALVFPPTGEDWKLRMTILGVILLGAAGIYLISSKKKNIL